MFLFSDSFDEMTQGNMTLKITEKNEGGKMQLPFYYYDIFVGGAFVGKINIRIGDNFYTYYSGHIGYEVNEEARGHGYARRACGLVLDIARFHGMSRIYIACKEDNIASYRTIEKLGAELLEICDIPKEHFLWFEGIKKRRVYQLSL